MGVCVAVKLTTRCFPGRRRPTGGVADVFTKFGEVRSLLRRVALCVVMELEKLQLWPRNQRQHEGLSGTVFKNVPTTEDSYFRLLLLKEAASGLQETR